MKNIKSTVIHIAFCTILCGWTTFVFGGGIFMKGICIICGNEYKVRPCESKNRKFCSYQCYYKSQHKRITITCAICSKERIIKCSEFKKYKTCGSKECKKSLRYKISKAAKMPLLAQIRRNETRKPAQCYEKTCLFCKNTFKRNRDTYKFCSRRCSGLYNRGENASNWKGGISTENMLIRKRYEYINWRKSVFERDNYTCQKCGCRSGNGKRVNLEADHVLPFAYFPELRFDISNGITLCKECHKKTDTYGLKSVLKYKDTLFSVNRPS